MSLPPYPPYKFTRLPVVVDAFQMTAERRVANTDWPNWMNEAWNRARRELGSVYPEIPGTGDGRLAVMTLGGEYIVEFDDWVVRDFDGALSWCSAGAFDKLYQFCPENQT